MPYFTKKGTGKNKGKTCVYKKEGRTKVGCTDGPIEKYMAALHIHESKDFDWLLGPLQVRFGDIKDNFKDYISVGDTIYISGWLNIEDIEDDDVIGSSNSIKLDMEPAIVKEPYYTKVHRLEVRFGEDITSHPLWSITDDWVDLGAFKSDYDLLITIPEKNNITESEEDVDPLFWIKSTGGDIDTLISQLKTSISENVPVAHLELDWDQTKGGGEYFGKVWLYDRFYELYKYGKTFTVRFYEWDSRTEEYDQYDSYENLDQNRLLTILLNELIDYNRKNLNESEEEDEWGWAKEIEVDQLIPGEIYDIKTGNGYYWVPELFVGKKWDAEYNVEMYKFKDLDGSGSGGKSISYIKELIQKGHIRPYDPNWSIKDDLTFSNDIEDVLKGNFVIYFKDGVYLDQTLAIQDKLFEMGFSFYTKGPNEYITSKDSAGKIQFFECFNWDTSNPRYKSMPPNQWDLKKILLVKVKDDEFTWSRRPNPRIEEQELFLTVSNHNAIVINGDNYITNGINESEEEKWSQWIEDVEPDFNATMLRYGQKFKNKWGEYVRTVMFIGQDDPEVSYERPMTLLRFKIVDDPSGYRPYPSHPKDHELNSELTLNPIEFDEGLKSGRYVPMFTDEGFKLKESEDELNWIHQQEPEKELKKTKSYVVDVSHLRPAPMRYSHDPSLTRQDILRRFEELDYDVNHIDVDEAKYFYIEPCTDCGEWDDPTWIEKEYWIDYNTHHMEDPSYGGKYQIIDIDELMFLLDNNLISESDESMDWLTSMGEPMTICQAQSVLEPGDTIMINQLVDIHIIQGSDGKEHENVTALVLDIDRCNKIQPDNRSSDMTILIHVNDDYEGFGGWWVNEFANEEHKQICLDGRCMFLICGDSYDEEVTRITKFDKRFFIKNLFESKKPINEVAGISFESREWADIIYDEIMSNPEEKTRLIIDGYDYPEVFNSFPIDYVVIDYYDRITGYGQDYSGYDNDGNYVVHLYVQPKLVMGQGGYTLKSALNHEMRHAWEDYNRRSKGLPSIDDTKESKELYTKDFIRLMSDDKVVGPIKDILKYFYYLSKLETGPYMENVYDQNPAYESLVRDIATKDFESFKDRFDLELNWYLINTNYDIPFTKKFKSATDFIDYSAKELRKRANKVIKKINKVKYVHGKL